MEKIKHPGFLKYILIVFMVAFCSFFSACDPDGFEVHFVIVSGIFGQANVDGGVLRSSEDGMVWDNVNSYTVNDSSLKEVTYYHDRFVAVGSDMGVYYSLDGQTWNRGNISGCYLFADIAGGETNTWAQPWVAYYVTVGAGGTVYFSTNGGVDWTPASDTQTNQNLWAVTFGTVFIEEYSVSRFVAVGEVDTQPPDINPPVTVHSIIWSQDGGNNWFGASAGSLSETLWGVGYGNNRFVAVGMHSTIVYSDNGAGWTAATPAIDVGGQHLSGVAYGNGIWVAVGGSGLIWYSLNNGVTWQEANSPTNNFSFNDIVFDGTKFVASGFNIAGEGVVIISTDGINWSIVKTFAPSQYTYQGIAFKPY